jgi:hypothetical protein
MHSILVCVQCEDDGVVVKLDAWARKAEERRVAAGPAQHVVDRDRAQAGGPDRAFNVDLPAVNVKDGLPQDGALYVLQPASSPRDPHSARKVSPANPQIDITGVTYGDIVIQRAGRHDSFDGHDFNSVIPETSDHLAEHS